MKKLYLTDCVKIIYKVDPFSGIAILLLKVISALVPTFQTLLIAGFVDRVTGGRITSVFDRDIIGTVVLLVLLVAYGWITKNVADMLQQHIEMKAREKFKPKLLEKISRLRYEYMENGSTRDKISRVSKKIETRIISAYMGMLTLLELILKVVGILVIMFTQVWWVALLILAVSVPCFYVAVRSGKEEYDAEALVTKKNRMNEYYNDMLKSRDYVDERTLFQYNQEYTEKFLTQFENARKFKTKVRMKWFLKMKAGSMATIIVAAVLIIVLVPLTLKGKLSLGMFMALVNAVFNIVQNMSWDLTWAIDRNTWFNEYFRDLREIMALPEDDFNPEGKIQLTDKKEKAPNGFLTLQFCHVSFKYPGSERYILKDLSFTVEAGKKYAFVGSNGAGKSTVIKLINGLYKEYEGEILVNGRNIDDYNRDFIATVFQDFARYPLSLKDNISIAVKESVSDRTVQQIIEDIGLTDVVNKLHQGMETTLGKYKTDSQDVSGGEWQKIALVRCTLSQAPFKILDEPTSAMDPVFETMIYRKFKQISQNKTVLLISHRLASVKMSDIIFVLNEGTIVETGSHQQLMAEQGVYRTMYTEQAKWYNEAGEVKIQL